MKRSFLLRSPSLSIAAGVSGTLAFLCFVLFGGDGLTVYSGGSSASSEGIAVLYKAFLWIPYILWLVHCFYAGSRRPVCGATACIFFALSELLGYVGLSSLILFGAASPSFSAYTLFVPAVAASYILAAVFLLGGLSGPLPALILSAAAGLLSVVSYIAGTLPSLYLLDATSRLSVFAEMMGYFLMQLSLFLSFLAASSKRIVRKAS